MPLMLKTQRDKTLRDHWYGVYTESDGKRKVVNLNVKWKGVPPASGRVGDLGDAEFEASREKAETALSAYQDDVRTKGRAEHLIERLIESKTGSSVEYVRIDELLERWMDGGEYSAGYIGQCKAVMSRFVDFMKGANPKAEFLYQVRPADAQAFMKVIRAEMSRATTKAYAGILRPAFDLCLPHGMQNPFRSSKSDKKKTAVEAKEGKGFHRIPFTPAELQAVLEAAKDDPMMYGLITACACTGMRRGDVCKLRWSDVDLREGAVVAKASKTGETVEVPIFEPLREVLQAAKGNGSEYVFPDAADMLEANPDGLTWRFKKIVVKALSKDATPLPARELPEGFDLEADGTAALLRNLPKGARRERIVAAFRKYSAGETLDAVAKAMGCAKSTVVADMERAEEIIGAPVMHRRRTNNIKQEIATLTRTHRERGQRAASVRDWHALRTTFVTLALSAGVPVELVKRVTGHQTTAIVMEHYFRPDREQFRAALTGALPEVLTGKAGSKAEIGKAENRKLKPVLTTEGAESTEGGERLTTKSARTAKKSAGDLQGLAAKVAAGTATDGEKTRLRELLG